jgi:hypothetical protein
LDNEFNEIDWTNIFLRYREIEVITANGRRYFFSVDGIRHGRKKIAAHNYFSVDLEKPLPDIMYKVQKNIRKLKYVLLEKGRPLISHVSLTPLIGVVFYEKINRPDYFSNYTEIYMPIKASILRDAIKNRGFNGIEHMAKSLSVKLIAFRYNKEDLETRIAVSGRREDINTFRSKITVI